MLFPRSTSVLSASLIFNDSSYAWSLRLFKLHVALNPSCLRFPDFGLLRDLKNNSGSFSKCCGHLLLCSNFLEACQVCCSCQYEVWT